MTGDGKCSITEPRRAPVTPAPSAHPHPTAASERVPWLEVKASGGIRTAADALAMIDAGATRLGVSASVAIVTEAARMAEVGAGRGTSAGAAAPRTSGAAATGAAGAY